MKNSHDQTEEQESDPALSPQTLVVRARGGSPSSAADEDSRLRGRVRTLRHAYTRTGSLRNGGAAALC